MQISENIFLAMPPDPLARFFCAEFSPAGRPSRSPQRFGQQGRSIGAGGRRRRKADAGLQLDGVPIDAQGALHKAGKGRGQIAHAT